MTKVICVNRKLFERTIGYGLWTILTVTLLTFLVASIIETEGMGNRVYCIDSILFENYTDCFIPAEKKNTTLIVMNALNIIFISLWIYNKQKTFKLSWCEKK